MDWAGGGGGDAVGPCWGLIKSGLFLLRSTGQGFPSLKTEKSKISHQDPLSMNLLHMNSVFSFSKEMQALFLEMSQNSP